MDLPKALKKKEYWQGCELTWTTIKSIKIALATKGLEIDTPLKGVGFKNFKKFKGAGWKVLLVSEDQGSFVIYKK